MFAEIDHIRHKSQSYSALSDAQLERLMRTVQALGLLVSRVPSLWSASVTDPFVSSVVLLIGHFLEWRRRCVLRW